MCDAIPTPPLTAVDATLLDRVVDAGHTVSFRYDYHRKGICEAPVQHYDGPLPEQFTVRIGSALPDWLQVVDVRVHELGHAAHMAELGYNGWQLGRWVSQEHRLELSDGATDLLFHPLVYGALCDAGADLERLAALHFHEFGLHPVVLSDLDDAIPGLNSLLSAFSLDSISFEDRFALPPPVAGAANAVLEVVREAQPTLAERTHAVQSAVALQGRLTHLRRAVFDWRHPNQEPS